MLDDHPGYQFLKFMHPHDRLIWWVGAIAMASAELEMTLGLIYRDLSDVAGKQIHQDENDRALGVVISNLRDCVNRLDGQSDMSTYATRLSLFLDSMKGVAVKRNRIIHDPIARDEGQWTAYGSGHVFTDRQRKPVNEPDLFEFHALLESLLHKAELFRSEAAQLKR